MLKEYKRTTNIGIATGFVLFPLGRYLASSESESLRVLGWAIFLIGVGFFVWGSSQYAKGKGRSPYWGVLGILYPLGFVVLFFLPDRHRVTSP
jgi:hypothetical protein